jgi:hypothetical protein
MRRAATAWLFCALAPCAAWAQTQVPDAQLIARGGLRRLPYSTSGRGTVCWRPAHGLAIRHHRQHEYHA